MKRVIQAQNGDLDDAQLDHALRLLCDELGIEAQGGEEATLDNLNGSSARQRRFRELIEEKYRELLKKN